jgi:glycosyltransferase involved in cell wall biosynthesis
MVKARVSACVMTFNNEDLIQKCMENVKWADEVIVVDSYSTDKTVDICRKYTDRVYQRKWPGFQDQSNYIVSLAKYEWILFTDADEIISPELYEEIQSHLNNNSNNWDGFISRVEHSILENGLIMENGILHMTSFYTGRTKASG